MGGISTFNININDITNAAEKKVATTVAAGIESPDVASRRGELSGLIQELKGGSEQAKTVGKELEIALIKAIMSVIKSIAKEQQLPLQQRKKVIPISTQEQQPPLQQRKQVIPISTKEQQPTSQQRKQIIKLPTQAQTAEQKSLIGSSDVLMSQIQKDFTNFKVNFAKSIRAQLTSSHGGAFQVIGQGAMPYTKRGGVEVLKIANMDMLVGALKRLANVSEKEALQLAREKGPGALVKKASRAAMQELSGEFGTTKPVQTSQSIAKITEHINKHGYEGLNEGIKKIIQKQKPESGGITERQVRNALLAKEAGVKKRSVSQTGLQDLLAETAGRTRIQSRIGGAIQEVEIPRPQAGPQGLPSIKMQSGRHRALSEEYRFTPGIMVASERAKQIVQSRGIKSEAAKRVKEVTPKLPQMILEDEKAGIAGQASDVMSIMKTDKKGRLELINAYRETLTPKLGKPTQPIPKDKAGQLKYIDDLSNKAKKLSIGFDDVLVALGKFSKTGIYDRLFESLTKESVGITSPTRTTAQGLSTDPQAMKKFNSRIREVFSGQELVEEGKPRLGEYQRKVAKLNVPRFAPGEAGESATGETRRKELVAYNRELEKYANIKGEQYRLSSQGIGEGRSVETAPDVVDKSRQRMNVFTEDIRGLMPLGEWSNVARTIAPTYHGLGGGRTSGGKMMGGLEVPLLQSEKGRAKEKAGVWGEGYGLNLQTVMADSANTFEDQIDITGKAVNRFATYIKPKIKDVKDIGGAEVAAKDIVSTFAPEIGKALRMKEPGKGTEGTALVSEISKILTGPGGESLNTRAVKIVEQIFTQLGTKMTTHAGSKGVVTFKKGAEGELGYTEMPTPTHELMQGMLRKRRAGVKGEGAKKEIDKSIADLDKAGTVPFVSFMHKDLPKSVQKKYKEIRDSVGKILGMNLTVSPETIASIRSMAKKELGGKAMTKSVATEVRMSLTGATKRLNLMEPLEAVVNNITGNVEAISPKLAPEKLAQTGEVSQYLEAMGYGWGPEEKLPMEKRTLPMYAGKGDKGVIAGQKFWQYPREPSAQKEWATKDIETGRKGQKLNVAAMGALMSTFGEKSAVVEEAMGGYAPRKGQVLENVLALKSLGEEPIRTGAAYIPTTGMKELPGVISKHEDLRDTILDKKFGAGGFAEVPEFEGGKEVGKRPLYIPSKESLGMYAEQGGAAGANKLATMYGSLLTNVGEYEKTKKREYPKGEKADVDILRKNVKGQIGKTSSDFRKLLTDVSSGERSALSGEDLTNLINYFRKLQTILKEAVTTKDPSLAKMKTGAGGLLGEMGAGITDLEALAKGGRGLRKAGAKGETNVGKIAGLLRNVKDNLLEPKIDTKEIARLEGDLKKVKSRETPFTELSGSTYYTYQKQARWATEAAQKKGERAQTGTPEFEEETAGMRLWIERGLKKRLGLYKAGEGKEGFLSTAGEGTLGVAAKQFGVTTDPKGQALEERQKAIERDKYRLKKELMGSTIGPKKGVEILQTRNLPAISGTLSAAINSKVKDFKDAAEIIGKLGKEGVLGDTESVKSLESALTTQTKKHEKAVTEEAKGGRIVLREGEVGLPAGKLEKLTGDYGAEGKNLLEAVRAGKEVPVVTTRFPMTGMASHQFAKAREVAHPSGRDIISYPGAAPGIDVPEIEKITSQLKTRQKALREERAALPEAKAGTPGAKQLDAQRASLTKNINALSKAIDLVTVKFSGFAQNADIDGDTLMVHAGKTKAAQKEIAEVERSRRTGVYGKAGTLDPRAFINQMMNYNVKTQTSSMAELADLYTTKAKLPVAKLFQTPEVTREMKGVSTDKVMEGLKGFGVTAESIADIAKAKGFTEPEQRESVARETLYEKTRAAQYGKLYVKTGLGESTESISRVARFMEASVGFGDKQIGKKEYAAWKPESVALGAVYGKGGALTQKAKPGREMQTMMNVLLEQVINQAMSAKHGGKATFQEVTQGMASGTLFKTMQADAKLPKKDQRFKGILESNKIIKTVIRDRLDALNSVDFAAEAKRHAKKGSRKDITNELVKDFSFEGFLGASAKDIQSQVLATAKTPKQEAGIRKKISKGELDLGMYFPQMQPAYSLRTSSASVEKFAKQTKKGKTTLDKAITTVLRILKSTGTGVSVSDSMMQGAFEDMFRLFKRAEGLGNNLEKIFAKAKSPKQKRRVVGGLERKLGMPSMSAVEKEMIRTEGTEKFRKKFPEAEEKDVAKFQEEYLFKHRKRAIEQHVKAVEPKKQLMMSIVPSIGIGAGREFAEKDKIKVEQERIKQEKFMKGQIPRLALGVSPFGAGTRTKFSGFDVLGDKDLERKGWMEPTKPPIDKPAAGGRVSPLGVSFLYQGINEEEFESAREAKKDRQKEIANDKKKFERMSRRTEKGRGYPLKYPGPLTMGEEDISGMPEVGHYREGILLAQQVKTQKTTQVQKGKEVLGKGRGGVISGLSDQEVKLSESMAALRGGAKGKDYAALTETQTKEIVKTLQRYTESLNLLLESASNLTTTQTAKIQKALSFIKQNVGTLAAVPTGTALGAAAKSAVTAYKSVSAEGLGDFAARAGVSKKGGDKPVGEYKTQLAALQGFVSAAEGKTGYTPKGMPTTIVDALASLRKQPDTGSGVSKAIKESIISEKVSPEKIGGIWSQFQLEKSRGELDIAMTAEKGGDVYHRDEAIKRAKSNIKHSYGVKHTPFLTREEGGRGRITGYANEAAAATLGLFRAPEAGEEVAKRIGRQSETAETAVAPVLFGKGRMEERLKVMWARIREFKPELAKAGKAFNFDNAERDLAIIKEELKSFKYLGDFSPEGFADIEHAVNQVNKMQKAVIGAPAEALPSLAIPGLETTETAEAAFESEIAANIKEMKAQKDLAVGETRKVVAKIPTAEGLIEKREVTLAARGAKGGIVAPGVVGGIDRIEGKPTVTQKEWGPSRRSIRLLKEFSNSTGNINKRIQDLYLGVKKFDKAAGTVDFSEALEDLTSMQMLISEMLKSPSITPKLFGELSQLKRQIAPAARAIAETPAAGMPGVIMKGMETPESAKVAFRNQIEASKKAALEREDLAVGQKFDVAATLPTRQGVMQRKKVQLTAVGEGGVVTGIKEQEYKPADQYVREITRTKRTRGAMLMKQFATGAGDVNTRISKMLLGVKNFNLSLAKSGQYSKAINFKGAEKNLVEIMALLNNVLKGAALLTEEERAAYKQAQLAAKSMYQKVVKTPDVARKGITMGGYETPESSLAAHRAKIEQGKKELALSNEIGKSLVIKSKLITTSGEEMPVSKRLTARGSRFLGLGGPVTEKSVKEREEVGGGQVGSVVRRVAMWGSASGVIYGIIGGVKQMLQTMKQAETGLVNLKKVMSHVTTDFDHMRDSAVRFAKDYGAELMGVFETMRIFAQQGLPQEQVKEMTRVSTLASNVTTMKPAEAAEALTSATRQFNIEGEKSVSILDSWNEVENKFAITAKDLADGFKKAGTAAKITGIDVNKLNGIITAIGESTRQTGKEVGTSLKFIFSRMATEKAPRAMKAVGVETMEGGKLRAGSDVLDDLAVKWVTLTRSQKLATAQAIGGIRHYNALMVMMDNYDRALAATAASINSVGSAEKENKLIMETYEKKTAQLKASFDALAVSASGPVLTALKHFTDALKSVLEVMAGIPGGGLAAGGALAYGGATALGKYFDLSMFGLLGSSVGGATRKRRSPTELLGSMFGGEKAAKGREVLAKGTEKIGLGKTMLGVESAASVTARTSREAAKAKFAYLSGGAVKKEVESLTKVQKAIRGIPGAAKTAGLSIVGMMASFGTLTWVALAVATLGITFYKFGQGVSKTFASAKDRTKDYTKSLDAVEERLKSIGSIKLLRTRIQIETERMGSLEARTPEQRAAQVEGRSYKSPLLMRKQNIENVKEYATAVAAMTSEGFVGFDKFGKAVVSSTEELGRVLDKIEAIGSKARIELKLHIEKEELEDLVKATEIDNWIKVIHYKFRELLERMSKEWGTGWLSKYADKMRNPFESVLHSMKEVNKLRREAGAYGEVIAPPSEKLKEKDPEKYERVNKRFKDYSKAQADHLVATKKINEKFLEVRRDFFTLSGPGMTSGMAGKAAFGQTGRLLAEIEREKEAKFYTERGASTEDIQASFFQRLRGVNVRATSEITREAAAEQGIPFQQAGTLEERREMLGGARAKDILMFGEQAGIQGGMASVFEKNGELWVQYSKQVVQGAEKQLVNVEQTLAQFREMPKYAKEFVGIVSSMGMLTPTAMRLRAISRVSVGAEAGMFKPSKERRLDLGKKYIHQAPTEMLIQNDAFKSFSKTTVAFINEYIKKQSELRRQQKAALSIYEKRGAIAGETATQIELLTAELVKLSNVAVQSIRINVELEKSLDQLNISSAKQAAIQQFRSENLKHLTGPMAGAPVLRTPKVDLRSFFDLTPHERLTVESKEYVSNVQDYNKTMDKYNIALKKGELGAQALADIAYVEEAAKEGVDFGDIEELSKKISKTGDLGTAVLYGELQKQTVLGQQSASSLRNIVSLLGGAAGSYAKAIQMPEGTNRDIAISSAMESVKTEMAASLSVGKYDEVIKLRKTLTESNKVAAVREDYKEQYRGTTPEQASALDKFLIAQTPVEKTSAFTGKEYAVDMSMSNLMLELSSSFPDLVKKFVVGSKLVTEEGYQEAAEEGGLKELIKGMVTTRVEDKTSRKLNISAIMEFIETLTYAGVETRKYGAELKNTLGPMSKLTTPALDEASKFRLQGIEFPEEKPKFMDFGGVEPSILEVTPAEYSAGEAKSNIESIVGKAEESIKKLGKTAAEQSLVITKAQKAELNLEKASGQLAKTVKNLTSTFRDLERQSTINQNLIETRAKYLSTRGGPMRQTAPSVSIDTATTAQYSPHELLYNKSKQYKDTITGYLKTSESLKAARSKVEEITKIEGKAEFMEAQGYSKEKVEGIINKALLTGSMDSALMITEQEKTNAFLGSIDKKTVDITKKTKGGELADGAKAGDVPGREKSVYKLLDQQKAKAKKAAEYAEQENIVQAEYIRAKQIEKKTALDIAAGRGRTQDQVNREESEWLTSIGYVPEEIKDRNKKLVQVHKEEKSAREDWELKKREDLEPLQKSAGGMRSLIDSIQTGVSGIKGARNIRPLDIEFTKWSEKTGDKELVADRSMQFDLAKSLYSQNLNLRAGGADTGVAPKKLYDIMQKASRGEDVTKDLEQIQGKLKEKEEKRKEQVRKMQAEEYARALKEVMTPSDAKLGAISDNTGKLVTTMGDVGHNIADAINSMSKTQPAAVSTNVVALSPEQKQKETVKSAERGRLTMTFPEKGESVQDFADRTEKEEEGKTVKNLIDSGLTVTQPGAGEYIKDEEKVTTMAAEVNKPSLVAEDSVLTKPKDISEDKQKKFDDSDLKQKTKEDKKVGAEQKKETKDLNDEVSNLKDEIVTLKTAVSDVNKVFGKLSKGLEDVSDLGDKSKNSAVLIETLGKSASDTSSSLDTLSIKMAAVKSPETETAATMKNEEGYKYISEDSDIIKGLVETTNDLRTGVDSIEQNLLEVSEDSNIIKGLVEQTNDLRTSVDGIEENIKNIKVSDADMESIEIIKNEIANYFDTVSELKGLIVTLEESTGFNTDLSEKLSVSMDNMVKRLMEHDDEFVDIQKTVTDLDTSFSFIIDELREEVSEAIDLSRSAYNLVNM